MELQKPNIHEFEFQCFSVNYASLMTSAPNRPDLEYLQPIANTHKTETERRKALVVQTLLNAAAAGMDISTLPVGACGPKVAPDCEGNLPEWTKSYRPSLCSQNPVYLATPKFDASEVANFNHNLYEDTLFLFPTNLKAGQSGAGVIKQGEGGPYDFALDAGYFVSSGSEGMISAGNVNDKFQLTWYAISKTFINTTILPLQ